MSNTELVSFRYPTGMNIEIRHIRYFLAVAEERNFTKAAERLHMAQPPLSRQIQQLEELLETQLIERDSRPLELTETGQFFYEHAVRLLAQAGELVSMTKQLGKIEEKFSLGFVGSTLFGLLPEVVRRFKAANPGLEVSLHEMTTMEQIQALKDGVIDVGIGRIRREDPKVKRTVLRNEELVVALPMGHKLAHSGSKIKLVDLLQDIVVVFPKTPRPSFADQVLDAFNDRGLKIFRLQEARDLQVALLLVAAGVGVSIVPKSVMGMKRADIVYKLLDEVDLYSPVIMSTRIYDQSETIKSFMNVVYSLYRAEGIPYIKPEQDE